MIVVFPRSWINPQEVENHHGKQIQGVIINHGCHGFAMPTQWMEWHSFPGIISKSKGSLVVVGQKNKHWMFSQIATFGSAAHIKHSGWTRIFVGCQGTCFDGPTSQKHWKGSWFLAGKPLLFTKSHRSFCEKNKRHQKSLHKFSRSSKSFTCTSTPPRKWLSKQSNRNRVLLTLWARTRRDTTLNTAVTRPGKTTRNAALHDWFFGFVL